MSFNEDDPARSVRKHRPAIWGIIIAVAIAVLLAVVLLPLGSGDDPLRGEVVAPGGTAAPVSDSAVPDPAVTPPGGQPAEEAPVLPDAAAPDAAAPGIAGGPETPGN